MKAGALLGVQMPKCLFLMHFCLHALLRLGSSTQAGAKSHFHCSGCTDAQMHPCSMSLQSKSDGKALEEPVPKDTASSSAHAEF